MLDNDGWDKAIDLGLALTSADIPVKLIRFPKDRDVNDLGKEKTQRMVDKVDWMNYQDVMELYMELQTEEGYA
jgi:hypothetical protein